MTFMTWTEEFSVGVAVFDEEHKNLVEVINRLYDGICGGNVQETLHRVTDDLIEHAIVHFRHEEMYFDDTRFPLAAEHKAMHEDLKKQVLAYRSEIDRRDSKLLAFEMLRFLREWLAQHIQIDDKKYGEYLNSKGIR